MSPSRGRLRRVGAVLPGWSSAARGPSPGRPARRPLAVPRAPPAEARPPRRGERGAGGAGAPRVQLGKGRSWAGARKGSRRRSGSPGKETCQGEGGGVGWDLGARWPEAGAGRERKNQACRACFLISRWSRCIRELGPRREQGARRQLCRSQVLGLWGRCGGCRGHFGPPDGRKEGGHRGLSIGVHQERGGSWTPELVLDP